MRFLGHVWHSRPPICESFGVMLAWGASVPLCILADYFFWRHMLPPDWQRILIIYSFGAAFAAPAALWCTRIFGQNTGYSMFAAAFVSFGIGTIGLTAFIFAFDFWHYFVKWHAPTFSKIWMLQFIFTFGSAVYQFLVSGLRLYLPFGFLALVIASMWATRRITR